MDFIIKNYYLQSLLVCKETAVMAVCNHLPERQAQR
jgi:hypothetical protein